MLSGLAADPKNQSKNAMPALALHSFSKAIEIPASASQSAVGCVANISASHHFARAASAFMSLAICMDERSLISPGKKIVVQKLYMNWICLRVAHDSETGRRLVMVTEATAFLLRTISLRQTAKGRVQRCKKMRPALSFRNRFAISLSTNCR